MFTLCGLLLGRRDCQIVATPTRLRHAVTCTVFKNYFKLQLLLFLPMSTLLQNKRQGVVVFFNPNDELKCANVDGSEF